MEWKIRKNPDIPSIFECWDGALLTGIKYEHWREPPYFSDEIAAAWKVVEKLITCRLFPGIGYEENIWDAWVFREEPVEGQMGSHVKARHKSAPLAICRVAIKAMPLPVVL